LTGVIAPFIGRPPQTELGHLARPAKAVCAWQDGRILM
jgi:hypothetical protein